MRPIPIKKLRSMLPAGWDEKAIEATDKVRDTAPEARAKEIERHAGLWRRLRSSLARLSGRKCWYCETKSTRFDWAVDHFRPKNEIFERPGHDYWWLAFRWGNYRLACQFCNERRDDKEGGTAGGKRTHFPLVDESRRALIEGDKIEDEDPVLLDPADPGDPGALFFRIDGQVVPRYDSNVQQRLHERAEQSIRLYHLHHRDLVDARRELYSELEEIVSRCDVCFRNLTTDNEAAKHGFSRAMGELLARLDWRAPYSAAANDMLRQMRTRTRVWMDQIVPAPDYHDEGEPA
jgi:uncharacterized protein (TIGR02646 family)